MPLIKPLLFISNIFREVFCSDEEVRERVRITAAFYASCQRTALGVNKNNESN